MQVCYKGSIMAHEVYCFAAWHAPAALALSSGSCQTAYCKADGHMAVIALLPHGSTSNSIAALFLMLLHLIVRFDDRPEAVHAGAGGPHVCHADGPQGGGACYSQSSSQGQHLHGTCNDCRAGLCFVHGCLFLLFHVCLCWKADLACMSLRGH
jgi:hypothetical protein